MAKKLGAPDKQVVECNPDCELCPKLHPHAVNVCMEGDGPNNAKLMIIGEAPGMTEDEMNLPFVGNAGNHLRDFMLVDAGVPESKVRFTNTVRCHPPKNRNPSALEVRKCRPYLVEEIKRIKPRVIVGMGNVPLATILQRFYKGKQEEGTSKKSESVIGGITKWQGKQIWLQEFGCWFIPTFHPSYCLRNEAKRSKYSTQLAIEDLKYAWELAQEELPEYPMPESVVVRNPKRALQVFDIMRKKGQFAFDIETGGTGRAVDKYLLGFSLACSGKIGYYIPWDVVEDHAEVRRSLYDLLSDRSMYKIMHNGAYEIRILRFHDIPIYDKYYDTMIAGALTDENFYKRLKDLTWIMTEFGGYDLELEKYKYENHIKEDYSKIPKELLEPYGAMDAIATWIIYKKTYREMTDENLMPLFKKVSMPVRRVMCDAEYTGIYVDKERAELVGSMCEEAIRRLEPKIFELAGREFKIGSPGVLAKILYDEMGYKPLKKTKTGWSVDKDSIAYVASQGSELAGVIADLSYTKTMLNTHIRQALDFRWDEDGRIHANYNSTGAVTGRVSCSNPSLQNVPADKIVRSIYTASPGNILVEGDLKSAELATIAAVSGEETFINAFNHGLDPHSATYRQLYDLPESYQPTTLERRKAKTINFGLVYGLTVIGLAIRLGIPEDEAQAFMNLYFERMPKVYNWMQLQKKLVRKHGYVVSVFGRKRRLPMALSDGWGDVARAERQAMNAPIQSGAADYTYIGLIRLSRGLRQHGLDSKIVHTVHDCGIVDTRRVEKDEVVSIFTEAFETPVKAMPIKMRVDLDVHKRWGEGTEDESRLLGVFRRVGLNKKIA